MNKIATIVLILTIALAYLSPFAVADDSKVPNSGYLGGADIYDRLQKVKTKNGKDVHRWIEPKLNKDNYKSVLIDDVVLYPAPQADEQVSEDTLKRISAYSTNLLKEKIGAVVPLADAPGPEVLQVQVAITGVEIHTEGVKPYEILPVAAVFGVAKAATGKRAQDVLVQTEIKLVDSTTGELVGAVMRQIEGDKLKGKKDQLHVEDMHENLDSSSTDAAIFMEETFVE